MLSMEDSRLNKLVSVHMQVEPMVQDLAIQTEFVAPPVCYILRCVLLFIVVVFLAISDAVVLFPSSLLSLHF